MRDWKSKIYFWFEDVETPMGRAVDIIIVTLIFIVSIIFIIQTYPIPEVIWNQLEIVENAIIVLFIIEYILRIWSSPDRIREALKIYSILDLIAIIPIFFSSETYQVLRIFRVLRVLRLIRFLKSSHFFYRRFNQANIIIVRIIFIIFAIIFVSAGMIFFAENNQQNSGIKTFFDAIYFSIITLTTVGYGDITPVTKYGRFVTILIVISGIVFIPYQVKELIKNFIRSGDKIRIECNNCGYRYHDTDANYCKICGERIYFNR